MEYGLIGEKLGHSFSKDIHNLIGNYDYILKEIPKDELTAFMTKKDFKGINVTIPYKQDVIPFLDYIDPKAEEIGAVNTIVNKNGKLYGYNTDFFGLKNLILANSIELKDKKVLILGTGGTSKTALAVARDLGAKEIYKVSRTKSETTISYEEACEKHYDAEIILNTTPVGMFPKNEASPIDISAFKNLQGAIDAIYNPLRTNFILSAKNKAIKASGGLYMLVIQAVVASEFFFDTKYPESLGNSIFKKILSSKENIVFAGMPGCGKSTIGAEIAKALNREFIDSDAYIWKTTGLKPDQIIREKGVDAFRDIESECIKETSSKQNCVISTGGGAILREKNVKFLKQNGIIIFIDRKIENIKPTDDRPLSNNQEKLKTLYKERYPIYKACADFTVENNKDINSVKNEILKIWENK